MALTLLTASACEKYDAPIQLLSEKDKAEYEERIRKMGVPVPRNVDGNASAMSVKVISKVASAEILRTVVSVISAIDVLGFTRSHALGTLAGISDDSQVGLWVPAGGRRDPADARPFDANLDQPTCCTGMAIGHRRPGALGLCICHQINASLEARARWTGRKTYDWRSFRSAMVPWAATP